MLLNSRQLPSTLSVPAPPPVARHWSFRASLKVDRTRRSFAVGVSQYTGKWIVKELLVGGYKVRADVQVAAASKVSPANGNIDLVENEQQDVEASESEYESSDEERDVSAAEEVSLLSVEAMLKKYREALTKNDEAALEELGVKFQQLEREKDTCAKQVSTLNEEVLSLKERLLRLNADFDNFRKRSERDRIAISANVKGDIVNSLLPMVDNFERAKTQIKIETEGEQRIDSSYQGIYKQFVEIMKGLGVSAAETVGKEFDPNVHEAIMREESAVYAEGVVMEEFRRGFMLGDKLLRPAMVKVSSGPPPSPSLEPSGNEGTSEPAEEEATE